MKKRVICSVLVAVMLLSMSALPIAAGTTDFNDVFGHWAQADIMTLVDKGIISGYPDGTFQPDKSVTRAEFIKILAAALQLPQAAPAGASPFSDVAMTDWFFEPVMEGVQNNLIGGFPDGTFLPNDPITREQVAKILVRAKGIDETSTVLMSQEQDIISKVPDWNQVSEWAKLFVVNAIAADLMKGDPSGNFRPLASLTRAETAVIGVRVMSATPTSSGVLEQLPKARLVLLVYARSDFKRPFTAQIPVPEQIEVDNVNMRMTYNSNLSSEEALKFIITEMEKRDWKLSSKNRILSDEEAAQWGGYLTVKKDDIVCSFDLWEYPPGEDVFHVVMAVKSDPTNARVEVIIIVPGADG